MNDPFKNTEYMVLEFNQHTAGVAVLVSSSDGLSCSGYSARNRDDAVKDARAAADRAKASNLPLRYAVVHVATEEVFPASA